MRLSFALFGILGMLTCIQTASADLKEYLARPEPDYSWKVVKSPTGEGPVELTLIKLTSQKWQNIVWEHDLVIVKPSECKVCDTMLLMNAGGNSSINNINLATQIATRLKSPVAFLFGIPNQPLFDGKKEDALIAETFVRYLETRDESWPLLFPMVKSLIKSMDAIQAHTKEAWKQEVKSFIVSGASKRGWTSWLTGASGDKRVKAIAPLVIDTLNFQKQLPHQLAMFNGKYSEMIKDYTERKLVPLPDNTEARKLWGMVDPWVYRDQLKMPKMIINGANDPYWTVDALNHYWDDLQGQKYCMLVPNAGHNLKQRRADGVEEFLPMRAIQTLVAFCRHQVTDKPMPELKWKMVESDGKSVIQVQSDKGATSARVWIAENADTDFRPARWNHKDLKLSDESTLKVEETLPTTGFKCFYVEMDYIIDELPYSLCTQIKVQKAK